MNLPQLPQDKANHALYGLAVFIGAVLALSLTGMAASAGWALRDVGLAAAFAAGAGKEMLDWYQNERSKKAGRPPVHGIEWQDAMATAAGGLAGFIASLVA